MPGKKHHTEALRKARLKAKAIEHGHSPWLKLKTGKKRLAAAEKAIKEALNARKSHINAALAREKLKKRNLMANVIGTYSERIAEKNLPVKIISINDAAHNARSIKQFSERMSELCERFE